MHEILQNHEVRIADLERTQNELKAGMLNIENTVLKESSGQKELLTKLIDHHFALQTEKTKGDTEVKKSKVAMYSAMAGSGGFLVLIADKIFSFL